jgi:hypothetical protein
VAGGVTGGVPGDERRPALDAVFRPRFARWVTGVLGVVVALATVLLLVLLPGTGLAGYSASDLTGIGLVGLAIVWFCWRQATVRATPTPEGLRVRNLATTRTVPWAQIVWVRFGEGRPWVQLDLDDGDTLAVMGIQRADGELARREARRLATLVAARTRTTRDD